MPGRIGLLHDAAQVAREINRRLCGLFLPREDGSAPWQGDNRIYTEIRIGVD